jgi:PAS domain S-box-containing protein
MISALSKRREMRYLYGSTILPMYFKSPADNDGFHSALLQVYCSAAHEFVGVTRSGSRHFLCINEPGALLFGYTGAAEMMEDEPAILKNITDGELLLLQEGKSEAVNQFTGETLFTTKQGADFFGEIRIDQFMYHDAAYSMVRITSIDEYKKKELAGGMERERFEALFNYASMGIIVADSSGIVVLANKFADSQFGCGQANELLGKKVEDLIPQRFRSGHVHHREGYNKQPRPRMMGTGFDLFAMRIDGTEFPVEISLSNFKTGEGSFVIAFIIDITMRKKIEADMLRQQKEIEQLNDELENKVDLRTKQLQEAMQQLEASKEELSRLLSKEKELGDMKSRFVSMASHEFRTPLSTILSSASLVAKYTQAEEQEKRDKHIQRIKSSVNNLTDILNEFLSLGKIEDGKIIASPVSCNLKELLEGIAAEMQAHAKSGQEIIFSYTGNEMAYLDASLLRNAVINLLSNAIKFSPENKAIQLTGISEDNQLTISVKDNGIGISEEDQQHLFERFFRANNAVNIQGTGLGLHIVAKYIELLGGEIEYASELEKGTEFVIKFTGTINRANTG